VHELTPQAANASAPPIPNADAAQPPFDLANLVKQCHGDLHAVMDQIREFQITVHVQLELIEASALSTNAPRVAQLAHGLKLSAVNLHSQGLRQLATQLEKIACFDDLEGVRMLLAPLRRAVERCMEFSASPFPA
jgi:HPt (histidine-containing phosphotransfer) domain-containing protein